MNERTFHLAQFNAARMIPDELSDPVMQGFVEELSRINQLADSSPGFVWRLKTEDGNSTDVRPYPDQRILITLSVWESLEALHAFTYRGPHAKLLAGRRAWFEEPQAPHLVHWWIPTGEIPTVEEGVRRLELLRSQGPTPEAFTFRERFDPAE